MFRAQWKWGLTVLGVMGLRLDRDERGVRVAVFGSVLVVLWLVEHSLRGLSGVPGGSKLALPALGYAVVVWCVYYLGNSVVLTAPWRLALFARYGEERVWRVYEIALGVVFLNQGFAQTVLMTVHGDSFPTTVPLWLTRALGGGLITFGLAMKLWATRLTGLDTYYYKDMFLGRGLLHEGGWVATGPYRWFANPMYGVGNLQAYGLALWCRSVEGLVLAAVFQASIYAFYFLLERPFFVRTYLAPEQVEAIVEPRPAA